MTGVDADTDIATRAVAEALLPLHRRSLIALRNDLGGPKARNGISGRG
jgi:hypothetical protein